MHQVLQGDDADQVLVFDHGNDAGIAGGKLAEGGTERVLAQGDFEDFIHHRLDVAVSFGAQSLENTLLRNHAHHVATAHHRKIVLQGMNRFFQGIFQGVRRGERGEIGEHDLFEADVVEHGLEYEGTLLQLRGGKDDDADHGEPAVAEQAGQHQDHGDGVADRNGAASGGRSLQSAGKQCPQDASAIERVSRHEIQNCQIKIGPHQAAR